MFILYANLFDQNQLENTKRYKIYVATLGFSHKLYSSYVSRLAFFNVFLDYDEISSSIVILGLAHESMDEEAVKKMNTLDNDTIEYKENEKKTRDIVDYVGKKYDWKWSKDFFWIDTEFLQQDFANIYIHLAKNCMFLHKIMFKLIQRTWNMNDILYV